MLSRVGRWRKVHRHRLLAASRVALFAFATLLLAGEAFAADAYPSRPVRLIVPYPPGGSPDLIARALANAVTEKLGQTVVVENRAGANGMVATEAVARSAGDGYTLLLGSDGPLVITPLLKGESPTSPSLRLAPITLVADASFVLLASSSVQAKDLRDLMAHGRANPGKLTFGSSGIGSQHHLAGVMLSNAGRMDMVHIPYKGFGDAVADVVSGRVDLLYGSVPAGAPHISSGRLKGLATTGSTRSALLPNLATVFEQGYPQLAFGAWFGVLAPPDTPSGILARLDEVFRSALGSDALMKSLTGQGLNVIAADQSGFAARIREDRLRWAEVVKASGVKTE